jgi:hypothetical protein
MPSEPDDLLRELDANQPVLAELAELPPAGDTGSGDAPEGDATPGPERGGRAQRVRDWLSRRLDRDAFTTWFSARFRPWIEEQTQHATLAGRAFWEELTPAERALLGKFMADVRNDPKVAVASRSKRDIAAIVLSVRRALVAARAARPDAPPS